MATDTVHDDADGFPIHPPEPGDSDGDDIGHACNPDAYGDGVADEMVPTRCANEDPSRPQDSTCNGDDYTPPGKGLPV